MQHIKIRKTRLDHDDIRSLFDIQLNFPKGFLQVRGIHLIRFPVTEFWGRFRRIPEGAIKVGSVLGTVGHDGNIGKSFIIQRIPNGSNPSIHHVRGGHHVRPRPAVRHRLFRQKLQSGIVEDLAVPDNSAVAMGGIFTEADIRNNRHLGHRILECPNGLLDNAVIGIGFGSHFIFMLRNPKQNNRRDPQGSHLFHIFHQPVHGKLKDSRHGRHGTSFPPSGTYKHGINQILHAEVILAHHGAQGLGHSKTPGTICGKVHSQSSLLGNRC